jgi:hypothetical protein
MWTKPSFRPKTMRAKMHTIKAEVRTIFLKWNLHSPRIYAMLITVKEKRAMQARAVATEELLKTPMVM